MFHVKRPVIASSLEITLYIKLLWIKAKIGRVIIILTDYYMDKSIKTNEIRSKNYKINNEEGSQGCIQSIGSNYYYYYHV